MNAPPTCWIIAGPNGAGKTTFALDYLPAVAQCQTFINADLIAAGLSPLNPEREQVAASKLYLAEIARSLRNLFMLYAGKVSRTRCYLNSGDAPTAVFFQYQNEVEVSDEAAYQHLRSEAGS